jgi:hypothetical protein
VILGDYRESGSIFFLVWERETGTCTHALRTKSAELKALAVCALWRRVLCSLCGFGSTRLKCCPLSFHKICDLCHRGRGHVVTEKSVPASSVSLRILQ